MSSSGLEIVSCVQLSQGKTQTQRPEKDEMELKVVSNCHENKKMLHVLFPSHAVSKRVK